MITMKTCEVVQAGSKSMMEMSTLLKNKWEREHYFQSCILKKNLSWNDFSIIFPVCWLGQYFLIHHGGATSPLLIINTPQFEPNSLISFLNRNFINNLTIVHTSMCISSAVYTSEEEKINRGIVALKYIECSVGAAGTGAHIGYPPTFMFDQIINNEPEARNSCI